MIITVFTTGNSDRDQWQAELLEDSWHRSGQPGELLRLVACPATENLPQHHSARVVRTMPWDPHPWTGDHYPAYNKAASLMEWLFTETIDASLLLLEKGSIMRSPVGTEISPGGALGNIWRDMPADGSGAFGLNETFQSVQAYCVNRSLPLSHVQYPVLIHSRDLRKFAPRWLELTGLIRSSIDHSNPADSERLAYAIAAAEYRIAHKAKKLANTHASRAIGNSIYDYRGHIADKKKKMVWDSHSYVPWDPCDPESASTGAGRGFLAYMQEFAAARNLGHHLSAILPRRIEGIREAMIIDQVILEIPGIDGGLSLNRSAAAIWKLIDGERSMADITERLQEQHGLPGGALWRDVETAIEFLQQEGAVKMEILTGHDRA